jgi:hypothetical protein
MIPQIASTIAIIARRPIQYTNTPGGFISGISNFFVILPFFFKVFIPFATHRFIKVLYIV